MKGFKTTVLAQILLKTLYKEFVRKRHQCNQMYLRKIRTGHEDFLKNGNDLKNEDVLKMKRLKN